MKRTYTRWPVLTIPPNTPLASPISSGIEMVKGELVQITITLPDGMAGLAGLRIEYAGELLAPSYPREWITGNDVTITLPFQFTIERDPAMFTLYGYNLDDTYPHTFIVSLCELITGESSVLANLQAWLSSNT